MNNLRNNLGQFKKGYIPHNIDKYLCILTKNDWFNLYINKKLSTHKIAKLFNVSQVTIYKYLKKFKIKLRTLSEAQKGRISPMKGKQHSKQTKKIISESLKGKSGELSRNWQGGLSNEEYPWYFNNLLKNKIRKRDNFKCQNCGILEKNYYRNLDIHHIDYNKENCKENNLIALCNKCNVNANKDRDYWYAYYTYIMEEI